MAAAGACGAGRGWTPVASSVVSGLGGTAGAAARPAGAAASEQDTAGPRSGWPRRIRHAPVISTRSTRSRPTNVPLVLPASSSSHWPLSARKTACSQETVGSSSTRSDWGSRPIRYRDPG